MFPFLLTFPWAPVFMCLLAAHLWSLASVVSPPLWGTLSTESGVRPHLTPIGHQTSPEPPPLPPKTALDFLEAASHRWFPLSTRSVETPCDFPAVATKPRCSHSVPLKQHFYHCQLIFAIAVDQASSPTHGRPLFCVSLTFLLSPFIQIVTDVRLFSVFTCP